MPQPEAPSQAASLPEISVLAQVWQQPFERHDDGPRWRTKADKPTAGQVITTPHDPEARFTAHDDKTWTGYQVHWTETCDAERPHIITHVATTSADTRDVELIPRIHAALKRLDLPPSAHWVDAGYTSGPHVVDNQQDYGVRLVGPLLEDRSWQARTPGGMALDPFRIDFEPQQATCPQGQVSSHWTATVCEDGSAKVQVAFPTAICQACDFRERCTRSRKRGRFLQLRGTYAALQAGRQQQHTDAFWEEYRLRAGIEGTVSALVRQHGARRTRYIGSRKTEVQALLTAMAVNIRRAALWLMGQRPGTTRLASLHCLAPA